MSAIHALIVAAGSGRRFGADCPKQYLPLTVNGTTQAVLQYSVQALVRHPEIKACTLVVAPNDEFVNTLAFALPVRLVAGGMERWQSVMYGVQKIAEHASNDDLILIHDAARPCLELKDLTAVIDVAKNERYGAILATAVVDTLKKSRADTSTINTDSTNSAPQSDDGNNAVATGVSCYIDHTVSRQDIWQAQTPQIYRLGALLTVLDWLRKQHKTAQRQRLHLPKKSKSNNLYALDKHTLDKQQAIVSDEAMGFESLGLPVALVAGSANNIKLTYPSDLPLIEAILASQKRSP